MRTTIDLPDKLFRRIKALASLEGISLKFFVQVALENELQNFSKKGTTHKRVKLPLVPSDKPGSLKISNADIEELLA